MSSAVSLVCSSHLSPQGNAFRMLNEKKVVFVFSLYHLYCLWCVAEKDPLMMLLVLSLILQSSISVK